MATPVSLTLPQFSRSVDLTLEAVDAAAGLGYAGVFCFDHLVPLDDPHRPVLEAAALIGAVAVRARVRVGTMVLRAPLRGPGISVALAATATALARAGFVLGVGAGDAQSQEEARRFGQPRVGLAERLGAVRDTILGAQAHDVPVWVGGQHPRMRQLTVELADGWNGWGLGTETLAGICAELRAARSDLILSWGGGVVIARSRHELERLLVERGGAGGVLAGTPEQVVAALEERVAAGVDELVVSVLPNRPERWELFAREVLPALA